MAGLKSAMDAMTVEGQLYDRLPEDRVRCLACAHRCNIRPGQRGICQVRFNQDGALRVPAGYVLSAAADPIEKKPFFHFLPGSTAFTFGMPGCNFRCGFCQNWVSSQALRDPQAVLHGGHLQRATAEQVVAAAVRSGAKIIASSYNEPLITAEWAAQIFKLAHQHGLKTAFVSNGYATVECLNYLRPHLDGFKVDLKTLDDSKYRALGGSLAPVLESIQTAYKLGLWVEVVTLVIPGYNDDPQELLGIGRSVAAVSPDIPWHVTAFHPDYHMADTIATPVDTLHMAAEIGQEAGLKYVYAGNLPGRLGKLEDTLCPKCGKVLIERTGFMLRRYEITADGKCPQCGSVIAGIWTDDPRSVETDSWGLPGRPVW